MFRYIRLLPVLLFVSCSLFSQTERTRFNFNRGWLLALGDSAGAAEASFDDTEWKRVTLPRAWNEDDALRVSIHDQRTGIAWYRKHFVLNAKQGKHVFVEFEGVRQAAEVYLNGHHLGLSENGVAAFGFDLTPYLRERDNVIAVRTDNSWEYRERASQVAVQWNNINFNSNFGGINRNVWLHVTPAVHQTLPLYSSLGTTGQYIWADAFDLAGHEASIHIESQVQNESNQPVQLRLRGKIAEIDGSPIAGAFSEVVTLAPHAMRTLAVTVRASHLHFWSWGYGYLYNVDTALIVNGRATDTVTTRTGFRKTEFRDGMVFLNDRVIQLHGYAARATNEWPALGTNIPPWVSDFSNGLIVQGNGNLVRWMHVTPSRQDITSCDRIGLIEAMPAGDAEHDSEGRQWQARVELMRDAIVYNRNSPSIMFYESGNRAISEEHMRAMLAIRNEFDPHGGRAVGSREMLASKSAEYGGEMLSIDKSATKPLWAHEYNRDEGSRKFWDDATKPFHKDLPPYNRNQDSFTLEDVLRWDDYFRARPGTGRRVIAGGANIGWIDENSHFRGDNNYRRSGEVDSMRIPKDAFFAHQTIWDGWVDPEYPRIHINGHWNYTAGTKRTIYVEANTALVELKLNGRSLGVQRPTHDFLFVFPEIAFEPGKLEAIGFSAEHYQQTSTALETAGEAAKLRLTLHEGPRGLRADGADIVLVDVEVVDAQGQRIPTANNLIHFSLSGPAEWRGGMAQGTGKPALINTHPTYNHGLSATAIPPYLLYDNYILSRDLPVECGINRVSIRSSEQTGDIVLTATADGLTSAQLKFRSHAVPEEHGLSQGDPAFLQPLHLDRGPTPSTPSYKTTRLPVAIVAATAGANAAEVAQSYDDNEVSAWSNAPANGQNLSSATLDNAWIEYTLAAPVMPDQLEIKLALFRVRRYPLRVTLDGQIVYQGTPPTGFGYVTLPLAAKTPGTHLRIALAGVPFNVPETHKLVELNGTVEQEGVMNEVVAPILSIVEAEIYQFARNNP